MPLYEYQCDVCGHRFELIQKFSDLPVEKCPSCGGTVHKLQSAPAIQFKGAGFYITDYAKKEHTAAAKADSGPADTTGSKEGSTGKTDKSVTSEKSSSPSETTPSSPSTASSSTKDSSDR